MEYLFEQLKSILQTKKDLGKDYIDERYVGGYILIRWINFLDVDPSIRLSINQYMETVKIGIFPDNYTEYLYLLNVIPTIPNPKYKYISKQKKTKKTQDLKIDKLIAFLAENLEISKKEAKYLVDNNFIDKEQIIKNL